jgi:hypothetical protein
VLDGGAPERLGAPAGSRLAQDWLALTKAGLVRIEDGKIAPPLKFGAGMAG